MNLPADHTQLSKKEKIIKFFSQLTPHEIISLVISSIGLFFIIWYTFINKHIKETNRRSVELQIQTIKTSDSLAAIQNECYLNSYNFNYTTDSVHHKINVGFSLTNYGKNLIQLKTEKTFFTPIPKALDSAAMVWNFDKSQAKTEQADDFLIPNSIEPFGKMMYSHDTLNKKMYDDVLTGHVPICMLTQFTYVNIGTSHGRVYEFYIILQVKGEKMQGHFVFNFNRDIDAFPQISPPEDIFIPIKY